MRSLFSSIRLAGNPISKKQMWCNTLAILVLGTALGVFSKFLDTVGINKQPLLFQYLDVGNFLGRYSVWVLIAVCLSVYSNSSIRAGVNVFTFFLGMVTSYYLYSNFVAGFFPRSYAMIWFALTAISPFLAFACWYAKGNGKIAMLISAAIIAFLFNQAFAYGMWYFDVYYGLEVLVLLAGMAVLKRSTIKETGIVYLVGVILALVARVIELFPI